VVTEGPSFELIFTELSTNQNKTLDIKRLIRFGEEEVQERHWKLENNFADEKGPSGEKWEAIVEYQVNDHNYVSEESLSFAYPDAYPEAFMY
jgi:hypothetical protein